MLDITAFIANLGEVNLSEDPVLNAIGAGFVVVVCVTVYILWIIDYEKSRKRREE